MLVKEKVDLVVEFQSHERVAPTIAALFLEAHIPVIAIEIPHPGATFFGANNYQAGLLGGRAIAKWVKQRWNGQADSVLLIEEEAAGPLVKLRVTGMLAGITEVLPSLEKCANDPPGRARLARVYLGCGPSPDPAIARPAYSSARDE